MAEARLLHSWSLQPTAAGPGEGSREELEELTPQEDVQSTCEKLHLQCSICRIGSQGLRDCSQWLGERGGQGVPKEEGVTSINGGVRT